MINCTETDGNTRQENIFNRCCPAGMLVMTHSPKHAYDLTLNPSHCSCSVNLSSSEYISPAGDPNSITAISCTFSAGTLASSNDYDNGEAYTSESPPVSKRVIDSEVLLI